MESGPSGKYRMNRGFFSRASVPSFVTPTCILQHSLFMSLECFPQPHSSPEVRVVLSRTLLPRYPNNSNLWSSEYRHCLIRFVWKSIGSSFIYPTCTGDYLISSHKLVVFDTPDTPSCFLCADEHTWGSGLLPPATISKTAKHDNNVSNSDRSSPHNLYLETSICDALADTRLRFSRVCQCIYAWLHRGADPSAAQLYNYRDNCKAFLRS